MCLYRYSFHGEYGVARLFQRQFAYMFLLIWVRMWKWSCGTWRWSRWGCNCWCRCLWSWTHSCTSNETETKSKVLTYFGTIRPIHLNRTFWGVSNILRKKVLAENRSSCHPSPTDVHEYLSKWIVEDFSHIWYNHNENQLTIKLVNMKLSSTQHNRLPVYLI